MNWLRMRDYRALQAIELQVNALHCIIYIKVASGLSAFANIVSGMPATA